MPSRPGAPDDDATVMPWRARSLPAAIAAIIPPPSEPTQATTAAWRTPMPRG